MRKIVFLFFTILLSIVFSQCCKENNNGLPLVETSNVDSISFSSALVGGNVINEGAFQVTKRGVCWNISPDPTIFNNYTSDGNGIGVFTSVMTGLDINTNYYVRAYASNSFGVGYGKEISFSTLEDPNINWIPGSDWIDIRDEQSYKTVEIGDQVWMAENLNIGSMIAGIDNQVDNGIIEKYCYENNLAYCDTLGGLYQWREMMQFISTESSQGICPDGWHIPKDQEWKTLELQLGMTELEADNVGDRGTDEGQQLKEGGSSGFEGLLGGARDPIQSFIHMNFYGYFWSSTTSDENDNWAFDRILSSENSQVRRHPNDKYDGFSVRCIKD